MKTKISPAMEALLIANEQALEDERVKQFLEAGESVVRVQINSLALHDVVINPISGLRRRVMDRPSRACKPGCWVVPAVRADMERDDITGNIVNPLMVIRS